MQKQMLIRGCDHLDREQRLAQSCAARSEIVLWHPASEDELDVVYAGRPVPMTALDGGVQLKIEVGSDPGPIERRRKDGEVLERVVLRTSPATELALSPEDLQPDRIEESILRNERVFDGADEGMAVFAAVNLLQLHLVTGRPAVARGLGLDALRRFRNSMQHRAVGTIAAITAHVLLQSSSSRAQLDLVLAALEHHGRFDASTLAQFHFNEGRVAVETSNHRRAISAFAAAGEIASRVAMADVTMAAGVEELYVTAMVGDFENFSRRVDPVRGRLKDAGLSDCDYGRSLSNLAWSSMVAEEARDAPDFTKTLEILADARPFFEPGGRCEDGKSRVDAALNAAFAHLRQGQLAQAQIALASFEQTTTATQAQWRQLIHGMLEAKRGETSAALNAFVDLVRRAEEQSQFDLAWRAMIAAADAAYEQGEIEDSLAFHRAANRLISDQLWSVSADDARELFVASRRGASVRFIERLLAQGRSEEAWCEFRLSRTMALRTFMEAQTDATSDEVREGDDRNSRAVEAWRSRRAALEESRREDWGRSAQDLKRAKSLRARATVELRAELDEVLEKIERSVSAAGFGAAPTCEELRPIAPGELWIGLLPSATGETTLFFVDETGVEHHAFEAQPSISSDTVLGVVGADATLASIDARIGRSESVHVLGHSSLVRLDVHALPWRHQPLIASRPVSYRLDLPRAEPTNTAPEVGDSPEAPVGQARVRSAFVVGDPGRNLASAAAEAESVAETLTARGWETKTAAGHEVRAESILKGVEGVDWFHYAGHAARGENGWSGELALGHGQRVTAADLYLLRSAPRVAVLAACEAGGVEGARMTGGLTLATSMLLRGSEYVVAPISKVSDDVAGQFTAAFYEALGRTPQVDFAFQEGLRRTADGHEVSAWAPFRLWRP